VLVSRARSGAGGYVECEHPTTNGGSNGMSVPKTTYST